MNSLKQIHAHTLRNNTDQYKFLITKLLQIPNITYARKLFDTTPQPTTFLYNKLIQAYSSHGGDGSHHQCLGLYSHMLLHSFPPNSHTFTFLFSACSSLPSCASSQLAPQSLHTHFIKFGFEDDSFGVTALLDMYGKCGLVGMGRKVFDEMRQRDVPAWNSMIAGYARCGDMAEAKKIFEGMSTARNVVTWTTMVSGYSQNRRYEEAVEMYLRMEGEKGVEPNVVTIASVLPACANLGALEMGERIEVLVREKGFGRNLFVSNALLEMYAKCGRIDKARQVFEEIGCRKNLCSWNSMIMGLAVHGRWEAALELFHEMLNGGSKPDDITFVGVLLACTHGGLVDQGRTFFELMQQDFCLTPKLQHYGCMVDLLGRAGLLNEAYALIKTMPMKPDSVVWGALLGGCSFHKNNVELAEIASEFLFKLEPNNPGIYVILSNVYALNGRWDGVGRIRKLMKGNQMTKVGGWSSIEVDGTVHKFIVQDRSHPQSDELFAILNEVSTKMRLLGAVAELGLETESNGQ